MEQSFFAMKIWKWGLLKYVLLAVLPSLLISFITGPEGAAWLFLMLAAILLHNRNHSIIVFHTSIVEKDFRGRFIRRIYEDQIDHASKNFLDEIILWDSEGHKLICVESNMSNRNQFELWLAEHHIEIK